MGVRASHTVVPSSFLPAPIDSAPPAAEDHASVPRDTDTGRREHRAPENEGYRKGKRTKSLRCRAPSRIDRLAEQEERTPPTAAAAREPTAILGSPASRSVAWVQVCHVD
ncbi:hypothetical protein NDU88_004826 [Pleurodeles waltl]|uniref:Uncharacterized protein n=1 Tax=Pleurodeles waltl TaxID=8319 RepID=A0AAV7VK90_PLEWA|nr:hypothetical protein NDU88_004826 [Pleurodeles waltl]